MAALVIVGGASLIGLGMRDDSGGTGGGGVLPRSLTFGDDPAPKASPTPTGPSPEELAAQQRAKRVKALDAALKKLDATSPEFSVAVLDKKTGQRYSYRGSERYDTASIVKVQVLACALLRAQDAGRKLSAGELALAKPMIRLSDNNATTSLFTKIGAVSSVSKCNKRLGLKQTKVNTAWGLTVVLVRPQAVLTVVCFRPSRLLHRVTAATLPIRPNSAVVALLSLSRIIGLASDSSVALSLRPASCARSSVQASTCTLTMLAVSYFSAPRYE